MQQNELCGPDALKALAERFPQLYVAPAEGAEDAHKKASGRGIAPEGADLSHFTCSPHDRLREVDTPAGPVEVVFLYNRSDFETFLQIVGHKAAPVPIAPTIGAITYRGLPDWGKVQAAYAAYKAGGGTDWSTEFRRLAKQPGTFHAELVVISAGPYSNIAAAQTPYGEDEWLRISRDIRLYHECAHVVCRRTMPEDILPVWDEITADVVGLLCATGGYDAQLATLFLGVTPEGYEGGRLAEYLSEEQAGRIEALACEVHAACEAIERQTQDDPDLAAQPFDFLLQLKRAPLLEY